MTTSVQGFKRLRVCVRATTWLTGWAWLEVERGPCGRGELGEAMAGRVSEAGEDSGQVFAPGDVHPSAGFDDREDGGDFGSGLLTADVDPVFATERHRAHGVFGKVVAELEFRVFEEAREFRPKRQREVRSFGQGAGGQ